MSLNHPSKNMVKIGTTLYEWEEDGIRFIIIQGRFGLCAYLGIDNRHPLAGFHYNEIPLKCHGGLTCARNRDGSERSRTIWKPLGYYWYGWSYIDRKWKLEEVIEDSQETIKEFKKLVKLVELISHRSV